MFKYFIITILFIFLILPQAVNAVEPTVTLTADPMTIRLGYSTILTWTSANATTCTGYDENDEWYDDSLSTSGSIGASPSSTNAYYICCTGPGGMTCDRVTITIDTTPIVTLTADPSTINQGESSTLSWSSTDANSCFISVGNQSLPAATSGTQQVSPTTTTTYTLTCAGPGGSDFASVIVTVSSEDDGVTPTVNLSANPSIIEQGESSVLTWSSTNATRCTGYDDKDEWYDDNLSTSGTIGVSPSENNTYYVCCHAFQGDSTCEYVTVTVTSEDDEVVVPPSECPGGLVPCGRRCNDPDTKGIDETQPCSICHFFIMIQRLLNGIGIALLAWASIYVVIGGITIMTAGGSAENVTKGKKMITYAIVGVVIGLGSWLIINTTMVALVGEYKEDGVMPWPWDKIKCYSPPVGESEEEEKEEVAGEYCVCEVPVYDLNRDEYPNDANLFAKNAKATGFNSGEECAEKCAGAYYGEYSLCPEGYSGIDVSDYNFYCTTRANVKGTSAIGVYNPAEAEAASVCKLGCFTTLQECENSVIPGNTNFENYGRKCFLRGLNFCDRMWQGMTGICVEDTGICPSSKPYALRRLMKEKVCPHGGNSLWDCITSSECYCRLGDKRFGDPCQEEELNRCDQKRDEFPCFGNYKCVNMTEDQITGTWKACDELVEFLGCMADKIPFNARKISSITDNSGGNCFNDATWDSRCQCKPDEDSCAGTCCAHKKCSYHYGGNGPDADCERCSWAVDFAVLPDKEFYITGETKKWKDWFDDWAKECVGTTWKKGELKKQSEEGKVSKLWQNSKARQIKVLGEVNHIHIALKGIAAIYGCNIMKKDQCEPESCY